MSYSTLSNKARAALLLQAKRQVMRNTVEFAQDTRPCISIGMTPQEVYHQLNAELFGDTLPDIPVYYNGRLRRVLGKAFYRRDNDKNLIATGIEIRTKHRWTDRFFRKVITHEMCHVYAFTFHNEEGHKRNFWSKMKELGYPKTHDWDDSRPWERDVYC